MGKKRFDNKNDLLSTMRRQRLESEMAMASTFTAYMMLTLLILHDEFGFGQKRAEKFTAAFYELLESYNQGRIKVGDMKQRILDELGMIVEGPEVPEWALNKKM